ncbi:MAG: globin domain-containing protein [Gemmatimonadaceae bacterium]|jgi:nitric oxide dioxygenase|nr:globin domain-containing protein [Gemmatimonadaceae bacterium]
MLTDLQRQLIRESWARITPRAAPVAAAFYDRLFQLSPEVQPLFAHADMTQQQAKLVQALALVVAHIDRFDAISGAVAELGRRHAGYGVRTEHYDLVGRALLETLAEGLGDDFTPALRDAWAAAFGAVAQTMQDGAAVRAA